MAGAPRWRRVFDSVERAIGVPLEDLVATQQFVETMAVGIKFRRAAEDTVRRVVHGVSGTVLHAVNIPTGDDVRRLNAHLTVLAREIRALEQAQRATDATGPSTPRTRASTRPGPGGAGRPRD